MSDRANSEADQVAQKAEGAFGAQSMGELIVSFRQSLVDANVPKGEIVQYVLAFIDVLGTMGARQ